MPMFYFHLDDGDHLWDTVGTDFADTKAAGGHAWVVARELMLNREEMSGHSWDEWTMSVVDAEGDQVLSFTMSDAQPRKLNDH